MSDPEDLIKKADLEKIAKKGSKIYEKVKIKYEPQEKGKFLAIDVESGNMYLGDSSSEAVQLAMQVHKDRVFYVIKIGFFATEILAPAGFNSKKVKKNIWNKYFWTPKSEDYENIDESQYYSQFGVVVRNGEFKIADKNKLESAYKKALENRDFEISKFWTRATYFWGFIALLYGVYFALFTSDKTDRDSNVLLLIICLGLIFSLAWFLNIWGSKRWQENWEIHIDRLEDFISGPIYKTVFHKGVTYSVSKINSFLSVIVILTWLYLFYNHLNTNYHLPWNRRTNEINIEIVCIIIIAFIVVFSLLFGYCKKSYNNEKKIFIKRKPMG